MNNKCKKVFALLAAATLTATTVAFAGCTQKAYTGKKLAGYVSNAAVESNGGFAVKKGDYVYFVNGQENFTAANEYGKVVKGALMRVPANDIKNGKAETVVPMLFSAQNFDAGIYIYDDYVYYATPTTDKNMDGTVENSWIDFKRAKLDGTTAMKDYYFRLSDNASSYRFVQMKGVDENKDNKDDVFCLYEEDGALKSYNTATRKGRVLVKNAKSEFFYDESDPESGNVYYTMSVVTGADSDHSSTASYDQLYCVNAAAKVEKVDAGKASYTVKGGKTYDFDKKYLESKNAEAKADKKDEPYNFDDYTTYPYVNLGTLVLDGLGNNNAWEKESDKQFNATSANKPLTPDGYNYTIKKYANDGLYFARTEVTKTGSAGENTKLYYLADATKDASGWNAIDGNKAESFDVVADDTAETDSAILYKDQDGKHCYIYLNDASDIVRVSYDKAGNKEKVFFKETLASATLWKLEGDYLYLWQSSTDGNGNNLQRINYKGTQKDYNLTALNDKTNEYSALEIKGIDWNSSWYKPELFGNSVLYSNEQTFGSVSYNYIYTATVGTTAEIVASNEKYDAVTDYIAESAEVSSDLKPLMQYYFRTGKTDAYEAVKKLYDETEQKEFDKFVAKFSATEDKLSFEKEFISQVGKTTSAEQKEMDESWADTLLSETVTENTEKEWPVWATVLIIVGSVLIVASATVATILIINNKKKKAAEAEATVNAYKRKIDTTDDKSIDVYADEEKAEETVEETAETPVQAEETVEVAEEVPATTEETIEESAEETVEETENKEE